MRLANRLFLPLAASAALLVAGCQPVPDAKPPAPVPTNNLPSPPAQTAAPIEPQGDWTDWTITPGTWAYRQDERGSIALFGTAGGDALVTMRCDRQRARIYVARASSLPSAKMTLRSSTTLRSFDAVTTGGTPAYLAIELSPRDPILDAIAYSRGRFALQTSGQLSLAIPVYAEIGRVIEDCR